MGFLSRLIYNILLCLGLVILSPLWLAYLASVPKARAGLKPKLGLYTDELKSQLSRKAKPRLWFHAVSVGEFNAIKTLIPHLSERYDVVISTTTQTGQDLALRTFPQLIVLYFPYDFPWVITRVLRYIQPDLVVLTETELWPNFIHEVTRVRGVPLILINGRLSQRSFKSYQWITPLIKPCLHEVTHLYMQSQADADRMVRLGQLAPEQWTVAGNLKFDLIPTVDEDKQAQLAHLLNIHRGDTVLTFASTHSGEDLPLLESYLSLKKDFPELKLILAPRHPERLAEIKTILNNKAVAYAVRSQLSATHPNQQDVLVLDSIGELLTVYSLSSIAVMGGSFIERGGQNPLEPLSQGIPVIFGPHMHNFSEISRLVIEGGAGTQVHTQDELINAVTSLLTQPEIYQMVSEKGLQLIENNRGAKAIILKAIENHLPAERLRESIP
ncbi:3-deoxy-D-manno-octulosonic acid transferase [Vampirovibrio chlorellavorus]|uniref:3-deoxy-D-manno-octulosonic acid transferase n=1 Tax=Vampirovibrio chlorellavorus TaxID=758823 RepID=UPI0026F24375|nr:3-deoxy-D-manno-octulosonic acid transferase [Vampirovibrio chlorellavorus]